jgi:cephalosporin hydroxylase
MTFKYGDRWCLQQPGEVLRGIKLFQDFDVKRVLEIGYWEGGFHAILNDFGIDVVSVDPAPRGVLLPTVIIGDSTDQFIKYRVLAASYFYDAVFIDGDHTYNHVVKDIETYKDYHFKLLILDDYFCSDVRNACHDTLGKPDIIIDDWAPDQAHPTHVWNGWAIYKMEV